MRTKIIFASEHMRWAKDRALELCDLGKLTDAFTSLISDLGKHPETQKSSRAIVELGTKQLMAGFLDTPEKMRNFIEGCN